MPIISIYVNDENYGKWLTKPDEEKLRIREEAKKIIEMEINQTIKV